LQERAVIASQKNEKRMTLFKFRHSLLVTSSQGFDHCGVKLRKVCLEGGLDVGKISGCFDLYVLDLKNPAREGQYWAPIRAARMGSGTQWLCGHTHCW
jgi:hypothetical protein